jgi:hypothetical protein
VCTALSLRSTADPLLGESAGASHPAAGQAVRGVTPPARLLSTRRGRPPAPPASAPSVTRGPTRPVGLSPGPCAPAVQRRARPGERRRSLRAIPWCRPPVAPAARQIPGARSERPLSARRPRGPAARSAHQPVTLSPGRSLSPAARWLGASRTAHQTHCTLRPAVPPRPAGPRLRPPRSAQRTPRLCPPHPAARWLGTSRTARRTGCSLRRRSHRPAARWLGASRTAHQTRCSLRPAVPPRPAGPRLRPPRSAQRTPRLCPRPPPRPRRPVAPPVTLRRPGPRLCPGRPSRPRRPAGSSRHEPPAIPAALAPTAVSQRRPAARADHPTKGARQGVLSAEQSTARVSTRRDPSRPRSWAP